MEALKEEIGAIEGIADTGLCVGVEIAPRAQHKVADEHGDDALVYSLRPEVEFDSYGREELEDKGLSITKDLDDTDAKKAVIGVRGAPPQVRQQIDEDDLDLAYDTTCSYVVKQEQEAADVLQQGRHLVFLSDSGHHGVERLRGIAEEEGQELYIIETPEAVDDIDLGRHAPVGVVVQTTFWMKTYKEIVSRLLERFENILIKNTACEDSMYRLPVMEKLVGQVDAVVVVGWSQGMVHRMEEVAEAYGTPFCNVDPVERPEPIDEQLAPATAWDVDSVGVIAANVTPDEMVDDVVARLEAALVVHRAPRRSVVERGARGGAPSGASPGVTRSGLTRSRREYRADPQLASVPPQCGRSTATAAGSCGMATLPRAAAIPNGSAPESLVVTMVPSMVTASPVGIAPAASRSSRRVAGPVAIRPSRASILIRSRAPSPMAQTMPPASR